MQTIAVLGATGVYGRHLVPRLLAVGHCVRVLARDPARAAAARAAGAEVAAADIFDQGSMEAALKGCDVAINLATALPRPGTRGDFSINDRLRREGTPLFVAACEAAGVGRVVQQSIAMVHDHPGDDIADEDRLTSRPADDVVGAALAAALSMEATVTASSLDWLILRGGYFYGPGTGTQDDWFARSLAGTLRMTGEGEHWLSLVHIADMAAATALAVERWPSRQALIVAEDRPARVCDVLAHAAAVCGGQPPAGGSRAPAFSFRVTNRRAREALGWAPFYADHRMGLAQ